MRTIAGMVLALAAAAAAQAGEWKVLFNGKDLDGWTRADGAPAGTNWAVEAGALKRAGKGGDIWTRERFGDFVLEIEFKTAGNSGIFLRTDNPRDCVQTGIEIQVDKPGGPNRHSVGALYDLVAPSSNAGRADDWNRFVITAKGPVLTVELNGVKASEMNLDRWTEPQKNPDGSKNKFRKALKDFKREGHVGLQDHGHEVAYRNIRIRTLD